MTPPAPEMTQPSEMTLPPEMTLHIGSARTLARIRPLGPLGLAAIAVRLTLRDALPLHVGDRVLLRDPGSAGLTILGGRYSTSRRPRSPGAARPPRPGASSPPGRISRRPPICCAATASCAPARWPPWASPAARRRWRATGWPTRPAGRACAGSWPRRSSPTPSATRWPSACRQKPPAPPSACPTGRWSRRWPACPGPGPARGRLPAPEHEVTAPSLPPRVVAAVRAVLADLAKAPFMAPDAGRLRDLGLEPRAIAAAARAGLLLRVTEQIVLAPGAEAQAARMLARLPQPFTTAEARQALGTTRRVAIPLLEYLDRTGITQRLPDDRRRLRLTGSSPARYGSARGSRRRAGRPGSRRSSGRPGRCPPARRSRAAG